MVLGTTTLGILLMLASLRFSGEVDMGSCGVRGQCNHLKYIDGGYEVTALKILQKF